jgi:hypothetical protein
MAVACSQYQSKDGSWQQNEVEERDAAKHSKPENKIGISSILRVMSYVINNPIHIDEDDEERNNYATNEKANPSEVARRAIGYRDEDEPPRGIVSDFVERYLQKIHFAKCEEPSNI